MNNVKKLFERSVNKFLITKTVKVKKIKVTKNNKNI
jgi:hypothetical protein